MGSKKGIVSVVWGAIISFLGFAAAITGTIISNSDSYLEWRVRHIYSDVWAEKVDWAQISVYAGLFLIALGILLLVLGVANYFKSTAAPGGKSSVKAVPNRTSVKTSPYTRPAGVPDNRTPAVDYNRAPAPRRPVSNYSENIYSSTPQPQPAPGRAPAPAPHPQVNAAPVPQPQVNAVPAPQPQVNAAPAPQAPVVSAAEPTKVCLDCGAENPVDASVCQKCGSFYFRQDSL